MRYTIRFTEEARERKSVLSEVAESLPNEPTRETRNLKALRPNPLAKYELRIGLLRAFFEVREASQEVLVLAIGRKEGNRLWVGGREIRL